MIKPSERHCDLCGCHIQEGQLFGKVELPLFPSLRRQLLDYVEREVMPKQAQSPLSAMLGGAEHMVPRTWTFTPCAGCCTGLFSVLQDKMREQVPESIQRALDAKRRSSEALADLEPETAR